jgi:PBSX family phage terminase large subunit
MKTHLIDFNILPQFRPILKSNKNIFVYSGGRGGGKSYGIADCIIMLCLKSRQNCYCGRVIQNANDVSIAKIFKERMEVIKKYLIENKTLAENSDFFKITNKSIKFYNNSSEINFVGFGEKTIENITSAPMNIVWVDECHMISKRTIDRLLPSVRDTKDIKIIFSYNPVNYGDPITVEAEKHDTWHKCKINFTDNPFFFDNVPLMKLLRDDYIMLQNNKLSKREFYHRWYGEPFNMDGKENLLFTQDEIQKTKTFKSKNFFQFQVVMGVDVARTDNDKSIILIRQGNKVLNIIELINLDGMELAQEIIRYKNIYNVSSIYIDSLGVGASPCDFLQHQFKCPFVSVKFGNSSSNKKYLNVRAESYFILKDLIRDGLELHNNNDEKAIELLRQMEYVPFIIGENEVVRITRKDIIKEVLGCSPDHLDALAISCYNKDLDFKRQSNLFTVNDKKIIRRV